MSKKQITKGLVGNALTSTAADHILGVADDIFDEEQQRYQSEINRSLKQSIDDAILALGNLRTEITTNIGTDITKIQNNLTSIETNISEIRQKMLTVVEEEPHTGIRDPLDLLLPPPPPDPEEPDTPDTEEPDTPDTPDKTKLVWGVSKWGQSTW